MKTSILMTTYNRPAHLRHSLASLCRQPLDGCEIVVINDATEDETASIVEQYARAGVNIRYLFTGQRNTDGCVWRVPGFALNIAIQQSDADIIILTNSDVYHLGDTVAPIVAAVENDLYALGTLGEIHDDDGRLLSCLCETPSAKVEVVSIAKDQPGPREGEALPPNTQMPYFLGVRRLHLLTIRGYDEDFNGYACDDSDLVGRLVSYGCYYTATNTEAVHLFHGRRPAILPPNQAEAFNFNARLQADRRGQIYRNADRPWGVVPGDSSIVASICIATYDKTELLDGTLASIYRQDPPFEFEVIVVDDGSPPGKGTREVCEKYPVRYHRIDRLHTFRNPCTPRNVAYRLAKGRVIIAQSDEVVHVTDNTIERLVTELTPGHVVFANVFALYEDGSIEGEYVGPSRRPLPLFFLGSLFRADLYAVGGNDEGFQVGPACEDRWFAHCLLHGRHLIPKYSQTIVGHHVWHPRRSNPEIEEPSHALLKEKNGAATRGALPWQSAGGPWPFDGTPVVAPPRLGINAIVTCVEYDDFLEITLEKNRRHFDRVVVVTTWTDTRTHEVATRHGCECFNTGAFHIREEPFNKGLAMEAGFEVLGRVGWICVWDADVIMPAGVSVDGLEKDCLYTPVRRLLEDPTQHRQYADEASWADLPSPTQSHEFSGYFQLFHAPAVPPPWYSTDSGTAQKCDSDFAAKFPTDKRKRPPWEVLHLGPEGVPELGTRIGQNWAGRVTPRIDTGEVPPEAAIRRIRLAQITRGGR